MTCHGSAQSFNCSTNWHSDQISEGRLFSFHLGQEIDDDEDNEFETESEGVSDGDGE